MREIIFDTETTGLDSRDDRVIELGGVELVNRFPTGRTFHHYINPQGRPIHAEAQSVHGISAADLVGKPTFAEIAQEWLDFTEGAKLVAHNATFDIGFLNVEFGRLGHPVIDNGRVVDTLALARRRHPMGPNSLDALCRRYGIDNTRRTKHGALLDSELLAEVYIELIGGKQAALGLDSATAPARGRENVRQIEIIVIPRPSPLPSRLSEAEREAHAGMVSTLGEKALWLKVAAG
ncbi:DNA polymerase III subunit epsilon [Mesorhizobium sp. ES1-1]|uniref:DNA polymerase III subunit epsilon n=1 Tax=Mesorhizobium sp. ES1-1 TaxID=2876629 RepID=UPI001CCF72ED|nr:DNA polymerase III subunit epsilon [Mesorhizobium sp. ES1-1]MBZ9675212.1 DNA polymerase III subunit epsilon [Mesorhizobium sp. ES1-1]